MKKFLGIILAALMLATVAFAADITVTLDGEVVDCESYGSPATIVEGRTLVPLRAIFEALGASVEWDNVTRTVTSEKGADVISLTVGADTFYKNDEPIELDVPAQIINDRTMVPARAIAEAYGVEVAWDAATRTVILTSPAVPTVELPEGTILYMTGETYTGDEGAWGENSSTVSFLSVFFQRPATTPSSRTAGITIPARLKIRRRCSSERIRLSFFSYPNNS